jgi:hypothetical protein
MSTRLGYNLDDHISFCRATIDSGYMSEHRHEADVQCTIHVLVYPSGSKGDLNIQYGQLHHGLQPEIRDS